MSKIKISLFASAVRPAMWESYLESLKSTSIPYEVIFSGFNTREEVKPFLDKYPQLKYIHTGRIKPAQNYEISRRACIGETISWSCDDAQYDNNFLGKAYSYWKESNDEKLILSLQTKESGYGNPVGSLFDMNLHRFFGGDRNSPLMAPMCLMSTKFLNKLGGYDRRYISGQTENDIVMRAYTQGAKVEIFGGSDCYIDIDHLGKSIAIGESTDQSSFRDRPFATGYEHDRNILQGSWCRLNEARFFSLVSKGARNLMPSQMYDITENQVDKFEPYAENISLTESEGPKGKWE